MLTVCQIFSLYSACGELTGSHFCSFDSASGELTVSHFSHLTQRLGGSRLLMFSHFFSLNDLNDGNDPDLHPPDLHHNLSLVK